MAITYSKQPSGIYPAYNDSFMEFTSDLSGHLRAEIQIQPLSLFPKKYVIYPDSNGNYLFNLKESIKTIFNQDGFSDINYFTDEFSKSISGLYHLLNIQIEVFNDSTSDSDFPYYQFFKAVKQIGEPIHSNPFELLSYSPNGINHSLTYFEGFPFHVDIKRVVKLSADKNITVKNLGTGAISDAFAVTASGSFRLNIDLGDGQNWTSANKLPLIEGLNRLEIYEDGVFKSNLNLWKKKKCEGIYLKWFNRAGGFSHFLFNPFYLETIEGSDIGTILNNDFENIADVVGISRSMGKRASRTLTLRAKYRTEEFEILKDIFISPSVQIYTSQEANVQGRFIDVKVEGSFVRNTKKEFNDIAIAVELPEMQTAKL